MNALLTNDDRNVRFWRKADIGVAGANDRFGEKRTILSADPRPKSLTSVSSGRKN